MVIADASGNSVPAAFFMALSRTIVRINATHYYKGTNVLDGNSCSLIYANTGHPAIALGALGGAKYEERTVNLSSRDVLVLYTDMVNEAENRNGEQYGIERFRGTVCKSCQHCAQRILDKILADLSQFYEGQVQYDDITMIVVRAM